MIRKKKEDIDIKCIIARVSSLISSCKGLQIGGPAGTTHGFSETAADGAVGKARFLSLLGERFSHGRRRRLDVVVVKDLRIPTIASQLSFCPRRNTSSGWTLSYIIIFHVSTGRSASLKLQSNFSSATGSSVGSWYGARYSWASASAAVILFVGSNTSIRSRRSTASRRRKKDVLVYGDLFTSINTENSPAGSAFLNFASKGCRSLFGSDLTNRKVCNSNCQHILSQV